MDKLVERINEIDGLIDEHKQSIYLLEDEIEQIEDELVELYNTRQRLSEDIAWRQMKI